MKIKFFLSILVAVAVLIVFYTQTTFNFGFLAIWYIVVLVIVAFAMHWLQVKEYDDNASLMVVRRSTAILAAVAIFVLGLLSLKALDNYFDAPLKVYTNADHNALRVDGISIGRPEGFVLAGNAKDAFFDDPTMRGKISIVSVDDRGVHLRLDNFTRSLFKVGYTDEKKEFRYSLLGGGMTMFHFKDSDTLRWRTNNNEEWKVVFSSGRKDISSWYNPFPEFVDTMRYHVYSPDKMYVVSNDSTVLKLGIRLDQITCGTAADRLDLSWLHVVRDTGYVVVKQDERIATFDSIGYHLAIDNLFHADGEEYPVAFSVDGHTWHKVETRLSEDIELPFDSVFVIGYGSQRTLPVRFCMNSGKLELRYRMPIYRYFSHSREQRRDSMLLLSSRQQLLDVIDKAVDNVALLEVFDRMDNIYNMQPQLISYSIGRTSDSLDVKIGKLGQSQTLWGDSVQIPTDSHTKHDVKWLLDRENLKATSHCLPEDIKQNVFILMSLFVVLLLLGAVSQKVTTTPIEFYAYAVTLLLVTLRWFLLWRSSVFLPVSGVSWFEYESLFRNPDNVRYLKIVPIIACVLIAGAKSLFIPDVIGLLNNTLCSIKAIGSKIVQSVSKIKWLGDQINLLVRLIKWFGCRKGISFILLYVFTIVICLVLKNKAWLAITVPALLYLLSTALFTHIYGGKYGVDEADMFEFSIKHRSAKLLICSVMNILVFSAIYAAIDKGYSIIFITFCIFWLLWLLYDHVVCYLRDDAYRTRIIAITFVFSCGLLLIGFYKEVFGLLYNHTTLAMALFALVGFIMFGLIAFVVAVRNWLSWRILLFWALTVIVMTLIPYGIKNGLESSAQHTVARIMVHFSDANEITRKIDHPANERRFYQAASNHSIIREYAERGNNVNLFGEGGAGYFKMQPHSKVGAMWGAQLTDISIVRYVIAEHSPILALLVIVLFLLMLGIATAQPKHERWTRALLIQIPLLLTVQSLLIWMATTGRFIFLGQDFPMLSINSRLVLVFYFCLIVLWVVVASFSQARFRYTADEENSVLKWRASIGKKDSGKLPAVIGMCLILGLATRPTQNTALSDLTAKKSRLDNTVAQLDFMLSRFQQDSATWSDNKELRKYSSISTEKGHFKFKHFKMQSNLSEFFAVFDKEKVNGSNVFDDNSLAKELWEQYVKKDCKHNDLSQIIHARMKRDGRLQLVLKYNFYNHHLPLPVDYQWRGNIISSNDNGKKRYWARNFQINGHRELIYPDGKDFFWIRTFGEELLAQRSLSSQKDDTFLNKDIELTLSPNLNSDLVAALQEVGVGASVIVANGDGEVWAMAEVKSQKYQIDPNNVRALQRFTDSLELYGGRGGEAERMVYGNANLKQIPYGPGSSQKPLVWTAVVSQLNYKWDKLAIDEYANVASTDGNDFKFVKFAGQNFTKTAPFKPLKSDENNGHKVSLDGFMSHSSNVYNAMMAYIGSFTFEQLHQSIMLEVDAILPDSSPSLFRSYHSNDIASFNDNFPIMQNADGQRMVFSRQLVKDVQDKCWLNESMTKMFFRGTDNDTLNNKGDYDTSAPEYLCSYKMNKKDSIVSTVINGYAYVERSKFQPRGGDSISQDELMELAIRSTAIGAGRVWNITPWKMAEAYGRMASLNSNLHLSIVKRAGQSYEYRTFSNLSDGYKAARPIQMRGMRDVFFSLNGHASKGTAHEMSEKKNKKNDEWLHFGEKRTISINGKEVFLYGKTGTTDDGKKRKGKASNKHRIGIIIANKDLTTTKIEDLDKVRYITMYFTMPGGAKWNIYATVINDVMHSEEFKNYMF
jgi:cell division protein FtsI/penicillin-binding protein 2